jgi:hypothetical protein
VFIPKVKTTLEKRLESKLDEQAWGINPLYVLIPRRDLKQLLAMNERYRKLLLKMEKENA